ncbi:ABC-2 transporter permease [Peptoniphilus raoultii]|uniref:ABC-2 transporter permease n=1 Tax=Peptoniphilus raoultii TaxID=1776387 RepID=UPI0008DB0497|nr:ABC-2 transporter permease [Peptoniphilus raoultii]
MIALLKKDLYEYRLINILIILAVIVSIILPGKDHSSLIQFLSIVPLMGSFLYSLNFMEEHFSYIVSLPLNRKDIVNYKYLINLSLYIISIFLFIRAMSLLNIESKNFLLIASAMILLTSVYSLAIPTIIKFGKNSYIPSLIYLLPLLIRPSLKIFRKYFGNIDMSFFPYILLGLGTIIFIISYLWSRNIIEKKEF